MECSCYWKALVVSADYKRIMENAVALLNKVPPGAGMAGVYARIALDWNPLNPTGGQAP